jgi:hypothetical protein
MDSAMLASCLSKKREKENGTRELGQELCALTSALRPQIGTGEGAVAASTLASSVSENLTNPPPKKEIIRVTLDEGPRSRDH